ncbi:MAG: DASH complex subunit ask1 [Trichoglossum hirsutum]|nr:MAG: DASH complex subunit ask1 [Trichoglossum hirsutum]
MPPQGPQGPQARSLSLTEELEKLEQSITLTLQEIDHNFSRAHRIVTTSILPIVEQYAEHSRAVWEGSKFWKQFFESSANVALSSYAELAADAGDGTQETEEDTTHATTTTTAEHDEDGEDDDIYGDRSHASTGTGGERHEETNATYTVTTEGDSLLDSPSLSGSHSTPRTGAPAKHTTTQQTMMYADYPSPYEALKRDLNLSPSSLPPQPAPSTPPRSSQRNRRLPDMTMHSSPFAPHPPGSTSKPSASEANPNTNILLHRVLDKNYRLQATPLKQTPRHNRQPTLPLDSSPLDSSPEAPQLHSEIFSSPIRPTPRNHRREGRGGPRTPMMAQKQEERYQSRRDEITWESDGEEDDDSGLPLGMSPPKTLQFAVPQSRLLQTPAREASKRIVEDLLLTAGANDTEDLDLELDSPSVVKRHDGELDLSF